MTRMAFFAALTAGVAGLTQTSAWAGIMSTPIALTASLLASSTQADHVVQVAYYRGGRSAGRASGSRGTLARRTAARPSLARRSASNRATPRNIRSARAFKGTLLAQGRRSGRQTRPDESHHHGQNGQQAGGRKPLPVGVFPGDPYHRMLDRMFPGQYSDQPRPRPAQQPVSRPWPTPSPVYTPPAPQPTPVSAPRPLPSPSPTPSVTPTPAPTPAPSPTPSASPASGGSLVDSLPESAIDSIAGPFLDPLMKQAWDFMTLKQKRKLLKAIMK